MELILKKDVQNIGEAGDIVNVKDGYARNYLLPKDFAEIATKGAKENREKNLARIKAKQEKLHAEALETAKKIEAVGVLEFAAKAGESGKLFGAITTKKLAEELAAKAGVEVDRKLISVDSPVNKLGNFNMTIKLTSKVKANLAIKVTASEVLKEEVEEETTEQQ